MIPPVEERAARPCEGIDFNGTHRCVYFSIEEVWPYCNLRDEIHYTDEDAYHLNRVGPCKYHYTKEEMRELIDNGQIK